jgi:predicted nicotinamide N-methyase
VPRLRRARGALPLPSPALLTRRRRSGPTETVEEALAVAGRELRIVRPRDAEALLDEEAFEHEEFLPYWAELWSSGEVLAREVAERDVAGCRVVELGCGLALPSLAAAMGGAHVLATDWSPDAVELAQKNARRNALELETALVRWSEPEALLERAPWDLVLAADVLYERRNVDELLAVLPKLGKDVLIADPGRPHAKTFFERAAEDWTIKLQGQVFQLRLHLTRAETNL